ncbi:crossover junction endodeoxyribonuclease RuvC [Pontibacter sp. G13]|uniref:crossover junction endodeoxyribonuclease RuvC n=1 Tax=Pontibacter sp. G13 TaxID=3074898 RepID=UPI002889F006|nr:crossover junction endodeoxyribonuclease RuvC [Pontibacter sp. G13]WNJ20153.1 crossover junction endodeoxyribonuclease RuvC [Pontibacter sp. G13]
MPQELPSIHHRVIIGIDPGTTVTGYGIISCEGKRMELLACGAIQLGKSGDPHPERLSKIFRRVQGLVREFKATEMALEAPFFGKNPQSMLKLGRAQGVAMAAGLSEGLEIFEYAPRKVKMAVTGNGSASKDMVAGMLRTLLKFEETPKFLDATDGLAVAVCHFFQGRATQTGPKANNWQAFLKQNPDRVKRRPTPKRNPPSKDSLT